MSRPFVCSACRPAGPSKKLFRNAIARQLSTAQQVPKKLTSSEDALRRSFDDAEFWARNRVRSSHGRSKSTGLFRFPILSKADGFIRAGAVGISLASRLVDRVCTAAASHNASEERLIVQRLDRLSDILCSVVDTAELVRNVHSDRKFVQAANYVHAELSNFMNQLNTHQKLYEALKQASQNPAIASHFSEQELRVANLLISDFEKSGIHMPLMTRTKFVELQDSILELGQEFVTGAGPGVETIEFKDPERTLLGVPKHVVDAVTVGNRAVVVSGSHAALVILRTARSEKVRKEVYLAMNSGSERQISILENMLKKRGELATLLGKKSFAHMYLVDKMAETPEHVVSFLESLSEIHTPIARSEVDRLQKIKLAYAAESDSPGVQPWDRYFYAQFLPSAPSIALQPHSEGASMDPHQMPQKHGATSLRDASLSAYFSVGSVFVGLSKLFKALYGITFEVAQLSPGEVWHEDVRKLEVIHETEGTIGTIYCDLFRRGSGEGRKYESAAHFTVRCSRRVHEEELADGAGGSALSMSAAEGEGKKELTPENGKKGNFQLPIVVLVTAFERIRGDLPSLLSFAELETLFHEMGHAMHSMLARTEFQHIAGTRVPMDFVEVPSILMEYFARSPQVLAELGRHYQTGAPLPAHFLWTLQHDNTTAVAPLQNESHGGDPLETQHQLQLALLDQMYHSDLVNDKNFDSTAILRISQMQHNVFPPLPGDMIPAWQTQFTHLFSYGATYYSYFWSRRWVSRIWRQWFNQPNTQSGGASTNMDLAGWKAGGDLLRRELLGWGGGRDPWVGLTKLKVVKEGEREGRFITERQDLG